MSIDKTFENEFKFNDDRGPNDLTKVIDNYEQLLKDSDDKIIDQLKKTEELKTKVFNAENETALIKATGINSPEMRDLSDRLKKAEEEINTLKNFTNDVIINNVINKHIARHKQGMKTFGKTIQDNNRPPKEWISEAQQEAMDFIVYLEKLDKTL